MKPHATLQVIATAGFEDPDRVLLALNTTLAAASCGVKVVVFMAVRATQWMCTDVPHDRKSKEVYEILDQLNELGVEVECCSACYDKHCLADGEPLHGPLREGIRSSGLVAVVQRAMENVQTLCF